MKITRKLNEKNDKKRKQKGKDGRQATDRCQVGAPSLPGKKEIVFDF